jgi:bla regulator protein BlaR1
MRFPSAVPALLFLTSSVFAQTSGRLEFEVASIKPAAPDARGMFIRPSPGGRINITNMTLKELMVIAYGIQPFQISGGPAWLDSLHYDITAKAEATPKQGEMPLMLQSLLADRFQLEIRHETKELPVYALVVAKKDGKLGPGLTETKEGSCEKFDPTKPPSPPDPGKAPRGCGMFMMQPRRLTGVSIPVSRMVPMLSRLLGRTVIDKTGLTANYDVTMEWTPDESQALQLLPPDAPKLAPSDSTGPTIFTALQEQLGLKLESQKGPVEIFAIVRAEKPSEN